MNNGYAICLNIWTLDNDIKNELRLLLIISSLCAEKGYCWASNQYFSELFKETEQSISNKLQKLKEKKYIEIEYEHRGCEITKRILRLKNIYTDDIKNFIPTIKKNFKDNNISINNINNNIYNSASINEKGTQKGTNCPIDIRDKRLDIRDKIIDNNIYNYIQKKFGRVLSPIECELISKWEIYSKEDIKECIDKAFEMNKYSIQYINTMLYNKKNKPKEVIKNTSNDVLPSWFDKEEDIKEESLNEEDKNEIEEIMNKYKD